MKKTRRQQMYLEIAVGMFVLAVIATLGFFTVILSPTLGKETHDMMVEFGNVTGLLKGDKVYLQGVDIGRVKKLEIEQQRVRVTMTLRYPLKLHEGYKISVESASVLGGRYVAVNEGRLDRPEIPSGTMITGTEPIDFIAEASETVKAIRQSLEGGGILANLTNGIADFRVIAADLKEGRGTLGKLITDDRAYNNLLAIETNLVAITEKIEKGGGTLGKLLNDDAVYTNLLAITEKLDNGKGTLGRLINDDSVYTNLQAIAANIRDVSDRLNSGQGLLGKLLSSNDTLYAQLSGAVTNISAVAAKISSGQGTLGKLVNNEDVYNELRSMIGEVRAAVDDLRETSPVASFSSVFIGSF
jgi:phospholipid/cholesterol/gamma-HCH transport system substrate-binding protein